MSLIVPNFELARNWRYKVRFFPVRKKNPIPTGTNNTHFWIFLMYLIFSTNSSGSCWTQVRIGVILKETLIFYFSDPFRSDAFDLEKHLPDELDLLPSTSSWPNLDPPSQSPSQPPQNVLIPNSQNQNQLINQQPKFQMNGESTPQSPSLMQVSMSLDVYILSVYFNPCVSPTNQFKVMPSLKLG